MARSSAPFLDISGLEDLRSEYDALGKYAFADALQQVVNRVAQAAQREMAFEFDTTIQGGPSKFTEINPGRNASSVLVKKQRGATKGVASASIFVREKQARYLRFMLGEEVVREPGDVGAASTANFIGDGVGLNMIGLTLNNQGNMPRNALKRMVALAARGRVGHKERGTASTKDYDAKRRPGGDRTADTVFFGKPRTGNRPYAFWLRPGPGSDRKRGLQMIAAAPLESRYDDARGYLVPAWNRAVSQAAGDMQHVAREEMEEMLATLLAKRLASGAHLNRAERVRRNRARLQGGA